MKMTYEEAVQAYTNACEQAHGHTEGLCRPNEMESDQDANGRWILRSINGFLAYVTQDGKVLDHKFQPAFSDAA